MFGIRSMQWHGLVIEQENLIKKYQDLVERQQKDLDTGREMILNLKKENASLKAQIDELRSVENET